jgi:hypothetical protein
MIGFAFEGKFPPFDGHNPLDYADVQFFRIQISPLFDV